MLIISAAPLYKLSTFTPDNIAGTIPTLENTEKRPPILLLCSNNKQLFSFPTLYNGDSLNSVIIKIFDRNSSILFFSIANW